MLTIDDEGTIRHALSKRLDGERGAKVIEIVINAHAEHIAVGVLTQLDDGDLIVRSVFHLPTSFELMHLLDEADEIAESYKAARRDFWQRGRVLPAHDFPLLGSGLRGRWGRYG